VKKPKVAVAREARAAEAKVSPATMGRADQIANRPDLEKKVVAGEMKPAEALREIRSTKRRERKPQKEKPFDCEVAGGRLRDWLRTELDRWPESQRREAVHWIRQIIEKEYGL